ncbi:hypothetical protein MMC13_003539 [Lambiella insularis]|nr:hypothetical protein [Lambiella insularis]
MKSGSSPFLNIIPKEIRDIIYEYLLSTSSTVASITTRPRYRMSTAILRVNKQIHAEAAEVLYKNEFVALGFDIRGAQMFCGAFSKAPAFKGVTPVPTRGLTIHLSCVDSTKHDRDRIKIVLLTGPECLSHLVECFWNKVDVMNKMAIRLDLSSQRLQSERRLLLPFVELHNLGKVYITGVPDEVFKTSLAKQIISTPCAEFFEEMVDKYHADAQQFYARDQFHIARRKWIRANMYFHFIVRTVVLSKAATGRPSDRPSAKSFSKWRITHLGIFKASLRLREYAFALRFYLDLAKLYRARMFTRRSITNPLMKAQFHLCESMAQVALQDPQTGLISLQKAVDAVKGTRSLPLVEWVQSRAQLQIEVLGAQDPGTACIACRDYWYVLEQASLDEVEAQAIEQTVVGHGTG